METNGGDSSPREALAALVQAEADRAALARDLVLPPFFWASIGVAVAVQIGTMAVGIALATGWSVAALVVGVALFVGTAAFQLVAFRRRNGVWLGGLLSRVVAGTATLTWLPYAGALAAATWAALEAQWWLVPLCAAAGGVAYVLSGRRWLRLYRSEPAAQGRGESAAWVLVLGVLAVAGLLLLVLQR